MKNFKRVIAASLTLSLAIPHMALAAPTDVHFKDGGLFKTGTQMGLSTTLQKEVGVNPGKYYYEGNDGKLYTFKTVNETFNEEGQKFENLVAKLEEKVAVGSVEEASELKVVEVSAINGKQVEVVFNAKIDDTEAETAGNYNFIALDGQTATTAQTAELQEDGKTVIVTVNNELQKRYQFSLTADKIESATDSAIKANYNETVTFAKDTTAPTITGTERVSATKVKVKFSEPVTYIATNVSARYVDATLALDDTKIKLNGTALGTAAETGVSEIVVDLFDLAITADKDITVTFNGVKDTVGNLISPQPSKVTVVKKAGDTVEPKIATVTQTGAKTFNIKFDKATTLADFTADKTEVEVTGAAVTAVDKVAGTDNEYKVTVDTNLDGLQTVTVKSGKATNIDGTATTSDLTKLVTFNEDEAAPKATAKLVKVDGSEFIELTFDKDVDLTASTTKVDVAGKQVKDYVTTTVTTVNADVDYKNANNKKVVLVELSDASLSVEGAAYDLTLSANSGNPIESLAGVDMEDVKVQFTRGKDEAAPNTDVIKAADIDVKAVASDNDKVEVEFTVPSGKSLDGATATNIANYTVDGAQIESATLNVVSGVKQSVILTLKENSNTFTGVRNATVKNVKIAGSTKVMDPVTKLTASLNENVKPTVKTAVLTATDEVTVTFSEAVTTTVVTDDFELLIGGKTVSGKTTVTAAAETNETVVVFTLEDNVTAEDITSGLSLKALSTMTIVDGVGNILSVPSNITITQ